MSAVTRAAVEETLSRLIDPNLNLDPVSAGCVRSIEIQGDNVSVQLELGYPADRFKTGWAQMLQMSLEQMPGVARAAVNITTVILSIYLPAANNGAKILGKKMFTLCIH